MKTAAAAVSTLNAKASQVNKSLVAAAPVEASAVKKLRSSSSSSSTNVTSNNNNNNNINNNNASINSNNDNAKISTSPVKILKELAKSKDKNYWEVKKMIEEEKLAVKRKDNNEESEGNSTNHILIKTFQLKIQFILLLKFKILANTR